jgi:aryl-alcohol dehydrogenase-like predicted oxidoreductase
MMLARSSLHPPSYPSPSRLALTAVAHIDALQIEYSPWFTDHEQSGLIPTARELGVTIIAYSPLGKGVLTGAVRSAADFKAGDVRASIPRFDAAHLPANLRLVDASVALADKKGCTPAQLALAWVIAQGAIPIPGTKTAARVEENFGAREVALSTEEEGAIRRLVEEAKPAGNRYSDFHMGLVGR